MSATAQRDLALAEANRIRVERANLRREATREQVADLIVDPPEWLETIRIGDLLRWVPRMGPSLMEKLCVQVGVNPRRPLARRAQSSGDLFPLTDRQREMLASLLRRPR